MNQVHKKCFQKGLFEILVGKAMFDGYFGKSIVILFFIAAKFLHKRKCV
jgi:hypothetical protein